MTERHATARRSDPADAGTPDCTAPQRLRVLIVDDEFPARQRLRTLLAAQAGVEIVGEADSAVHALRAVRSAAPDLVFLDVRMPGGDGFDLVEAVGVDAMPEVVFVTAFEHHAIRAFEANAIDYLLKPFDDQRFERAFARAAKAIRRRRLEGLCGRLRSLLDTPVAPSTPRSPPSHGARADGDGDRLVIRSAGRVRFVEVEDIDWIEAAGTYVRLHAGDRTLLLRQSLSKLEDRLEGARFVRIHRSAMVNTRRVCELRPLAHGESRVLLDNGTELKLSRSYRGRLDSLMRLQA